MKSFVRAIAKRLAAIKRDRRGVVFQETAVILPILATMTLAGYDLVRFSLLQQKLSRMAMTTADMVTQGSTVSVPLVDAVFDATTTMIQPFTGGPSQLVIISSVSATGAALPKVDWQRTGGGTLPGVASKIGVAQGNATLPAEFFVRDGENAIITEIYYKFAPTFTADLIKPTVLYHRAIFRPRLGSLTVLCPAAC